MGSKFGKAEKSGVLTNSYDCISNSRLGSLGLIQVKSTVSLVVIDLSLSWSPELRQEKKRLMMLISAVVGRLFLEYLGSITGSRHENDERQSTATRA